MRNAEGAADAAAEVILLIGSALVVSPADCVAWSAECLTARGKPVIGVQDFVAEDVEQGAVVAVGAGLGDEVLDAASGAAELGRGRRGRDFEFGDGFDRGSFFVEGGAVFGAGLAKAIDQDFVAEVLAATDLGNEDAVGAIARAWPDGSRNQED